MKSLSINDVCDQVKENLKCIQIWKYFEGEHTCVYHTHIPNHRINLDNSINLLRHLLAKYSEWDTQSVIETYLNKRKGNPTISLKISMPIEYPKPGVIRRYCSYKDIIVLMDEQLKNTKYNK